MLLYLMSNKAPFSPINRQGILILLQTHKTAKILCCLSTIGKKDVAQPAKGLRRRKKKLNVRCYCYIQYQEKQM